MALGLETVLISLVSTMLGSIVTSVVWSHSAFARYAELSERIAVLETKLDISILRHETTCTNFRRKEGM